MIVKHNLDPAKVAPYVAAPALYAVGVSSLAAVIRGVTDSPWVIVPFPPVAMLGAAVSIFVAFRNNASYTRWAEARTIWGNLQNSARILARQLVASTDNAIASGSGGTTDEVLAYRRELVLHVAAIVHVLRMQLRDTVEWDTLKPLLRPELLATMQTAHNPVNLLLQALGLRVKDGVRSGIVGQFDPITLEPNLAAMNAAVTSCERIKGTTTPRQYDYFTRVAVYALATLLPFALLGVVPMAQRWLIVPLSLIVAGVFVVLERVGAVIDAPFSNTVNDIPMSAISVAVERDLREQIGDVELPAPVEVQDGYLW